MRSDSSPIVPLLFLIPIMGVAAAIPPSTQTRIRVMILTGQSNHYHNWAVSSADIRRMLDDTGRFDTTVVTSPAKGQDMSAFKPTFAGYAVVS